MFGQGSSNAAFFRPPLFSIQKGWKIEKSASPAASPSRKGRPSASQPSTRFSVRFSSATSRGAAAMIFSGGAGSCPRMAARSAKKSGGIRSAIWAKAAPVTVPNSAPSAQKVSAWAMPSPPCGYRVGAGRRRSSSAAISWVSCQMSAPACITGVRR